MKLGRNDPCHCGSGNKYKKCCLAKDDAAKSAELAAQAAVRLAEAERLAKEESEKPVEAAAAKPAPRRPPSAFNDNASKQTRESGGTPLRRRASV